MQRSTTSILVTRSLKTDSPATEETWHLHSTGERHRFFSTASELEAAWCSVSPSTCTVPCRLFASRKDGPVRGRERERGRVQTTERKREKTELKAGKRRPFEIIADQIDRACRPSRWRRILPHIPQTGTDQSGGSERQLNNKQQHRMQTDKDRALISSEPSELPNKALVIDGPSSLAGHELAGGHGHDARRDYSCPRQLGESGMAVTPSSQGTPGHSLDEPDISGMLSCSCLP